ncbi:glyoxalase superfamily protein [Halovulum sp. GXIMD14794]
MTLESATPVLRSGNYARARAFYIDVLGFRLAEEAGEPPGFGIFIRDGARIFIEAYQGPEAPYDRWRAYFHVTGLDALAEEFQRNGAQLLRQITHTVYDMREFEIADPDGNVLCFGADP